VARPSKGKRAFDDVEPLGGGAWRCANCDAMLRPSEELGVALRLHRDRYCRHPASGGAAARRRERECQGCRAALAQVCARRASGRGGGGSRVDAHHGHDGHTLEREPLEKKPEVERWGIKNKKSEHAICGTFFFQGLA